MKNRVLAVLLSVLVVIAMIPALTFAGLGDYGDQGDSSTDDGRTMRMLTPDRVSYEGTVTKQGNDGEEVDVVTNNICNGLDSVGGYIEFEMAQNGGLNNKLHTLYTSNTAWIEDAEGKVIFGLDDIEAKPTGNIEVAPSRYNGDKPSAYTAKIFVGNVLTNCEKYTLVYDKSFGGNRPLTKQVRFDFIYNGIHPNSVEIRSAQNYLFQGGTLQLEAKVKPNGANNVASNQDVVWSSRTPEIAVVDDNGLVTGVGEGTAIIKVETADQANAEALGTIEGTIKLEVRDEIGVQSIDVVNRMIIGDKIRMEANAQPLDAPDPSVEWISSKPEVATVDANGMIKALSVGQTQITAKAKNGVKSKEVPVRVAPAKTSVTLTAKTKAVKMTYKKKTGAQYYEVYRSMSKTGDYELIATRDRSVSGTWTDTNLEKKKTYYYKVRSYAEDDGVKIYSDFSDIKYKKTK